MALIFGIENGKPYVYNSYDRRYEQVVLSNVETKALLIIKDILSNSGFNFEAIHLERRTDSYLSLVIGNHCDFLRLKMTERTTWFSLDLGYLTHNLENDEKLSKVNNKNQRHWKINLIDVDDLQNYSEYIIMSFNEFKDEYEDDRDYRENVRKYLLSEIENLNNEIVEKKQIIKNLEHTINSLKLDIKYLLKNNDTTVQDVKKTISSSEDYYDPPEREEKGEHVDNLPNDYIVIDIETTGFSPKNDEIIEMSAVKIIDNQIVDEFSRLIKPFKPVPENITKLTGITNEMLENESHISDVLFEFRKFIGNYILVGHNIHFDLNFIYDNSIEYLDIPLCNDYFDTLYYARKLLPNYPNHKLQYIAAQLNIEVDEAHRALNDCFTTHYCYQKLKTIAGNKSPTPESVNESISNPIINSFKDKTIVTTGEFKMFTRDNIKEIIINSGGCSVDTVTKKTDYLLLGGVVFNTKDNGKSRKHLRAEELISKGIDIKIIFEDEFYNMLNSEGQTC